MRAFIAIEVPEAIKEGMTRVRDQLRSAAVEASWSRPEGVHLTLKFLGEVGEDRTPEIMRALTLALEGMERFRLSIQGVGAFPNPASARVVWLGIAGEVERLVALQSAVERALVDMGMEPDDRPYTPHLTLGRVKRIRRRAQWLKELETIKDAALPGFDVASVSLVKSELRQTGAVYSQLGTVALKERSEYLPSFLTGSKTDHR